MSEPHIRKVRPDELEEVWSLAYGEARGTDIRCTLATLDPRAQARYVLAGMAPPLSG